MIVKENTGLRHSIHKYEDRINEINQKIPKGMDKRENNVRTDITEFVGRETQKLQEILETNNNEIENKLELQKIK